MTGVLCIGMICITRVVARAANVTSGMINTGTAIQGVCTLDYTPVCASVQVQCITTPCPAVEQTFGNACMMRGNTQATFLYTGECGSQTIV
jgi:hypothetical protein